MCACMLAYVCAYVERPEVSFQCLPSCHFPIHLDFLKIYFYYFYLHMYVNICHMRTDVIRGQKGAL